MIKSLMRKFSILLTSLLLLAIPVFAQSQSSETKLVEVLERPECQHCQTERQFFDELTSSDTSIQVNYYELESNQELWDSVTSLDGVSSSTPITLIGGRLIQGFDSAETTGRSFREILEDPNYQSVSFTEYLEKDLHTQVEAGGAGCDQDKGTCGIKRPYEPFYVKVPFLPAFDVKKYSLPIMSFMLGAIDGFNPCAMWVLVTFILVLAKIGDKKKLIQVVSLFLVAQAIMYSLILNVWIGVWDFVGLDAICLLYTSPSPRD